MEVLVVIAVVSLLVSIMLPALSAARATARTTVCASNARQLQLANDLYAVDHRQHYAPGMPDRLANLRRWHGARSNTDERFTPWGGVNAADPNAPFDEGRGGTLTPYLHSSPTTPVSPAGTVRACPAFASVQRAVDDAHAASSSPAGFESGCGGYGYNSAFVGTRLRRTGPGVFVVADDRAGSPAWLFGSPARTIAFADAALAAGPPISPPGAGGLIEFSFVEPRFWPHLPASPAARPDPSVHFRHAMGREHKATVVWLDGHTDTAQRTLSHASGFYALDPASVNIGWPGESDSNELFDFD